MDVDGCRERHQTRHNGHAKHSGRQAIGWAGTCVPTYIFLKPDRMTSLNCTGFLTTTDTESRTDATPSSFVVTVNATPGLGNK